ncbi:MAG: hypothetical protein R3C97_09450 [Geminicoccaceae bacterium]
MSGISHRKAGRGLRALGLAAAFWTIASLQPVAAELPKDADGMLADIRGAIEARDYERFEELVLWKDVGKIKGRVVAFQIRRGLGRAVESISLEPVSQEAIDRMLADGRHKINMPVTEKIRVVYAEPPNEKTGKKPTSVFLVGKHKDAYRIGVVVRNFEDDDDD